VASSLILDREVARFDAQLVSRFLHDEDGRARRRARGGGTEDKDSPVPRSQARLLVRATDPSGLHPFADVRERCGQAKLELEDGRR